MVEEYNSIMGKDVASRISKRGLWKEGSPIKREWNMRRHLLWSPGMLLFELLFLLLQL
jgi:hypothetical protein